METIKNSMMKLKGMQLLWGEAVRAFLCMLPMLIAAILGQSSLVAPLGQGGFFLWRHPLAPITRPTAVSRIPSDRPWTRILLVGRQCGL